MTATPPLACIVRGCDAPLHPRARTLVCRRGHAYDVARSGYVNLLQPQDRKSLEAGDSRLAVDARAALVAAGIGRVLIDAVVSHAIELPYPSQPPVVVELGAGSGETLGLLAEAHAIVGVGIDLSTAAATRAARRFPALTWVVANADRRLPLLTGTVGLALSIHARRNASECHRILHPSGFLLVAIPAADDLIELREVVQGDGVERNRADLLIAEHEPLFSVVERWTTRDRRELARPALLNLLRGTYRGERLSAAARVEALEHLTVTLASDVVLFAPRS